MSIEFNLVSVAVRNLDEALARYKVVLGTGLSHIIDGG
jgi:hypothetical protein